MESSDHSSKFCGKWSLMILLHYLILVQSGFSVNVVGTRASFLFPSRNVKDQQSWVSQLLSLDESEETDQISFGQHLGGVVQSLNHQFSNFILDHQVSYNPFADVTYILYFCFDRRRKR